MYNIGKKNEETDYEMKASEDEYKNIAKCNEEKGLGVIFDNSFTW